MIDRVEYGKKVEEDNYLLTLSAPRYEIRYKFKTEMSVFQNVVDIRIYKSVRAKIRSLNSRLNSLGFQFRFQFQ